MTKEFKYQEPFPIERDNTEYELLTKDFVLIRKMGSQEILEVKPEGLTLLANTAMRNCAFYLREEHQRQVAKILSDSIEKSSLYAQAETDYTLNTKLHGKVAILEFDAGDSASPITVRNVIAEDNDNKLSLVSGYPVVRGGVLIPLKITEIKEWENGLEA